VDGLVGEEGDEAAWGDAALGDLRRGREGGTRGSLG